MDEGLNDVSTVKEKLAPAFEAYRKMYADYYNTCKLPNSPAIRDACFVGIHTHATDVSKIIAAAKARHAPRASWSAESLALYTQTVIQGAFVLAKAKNDVALAADMIRHLRRYVELLFHHAKED